MERTQPLPLNDRLSALFTNLSRAAHKFELFSA